MGETDSSRSVSVLHQAAMQAHARRHGRATVTFRSVQAPDGRVTICCLTCGEVLDAK